jgi:organic radical activating enzyme
MRYPLANPGIFDTIQGEGTMIGEPMLFIRLAGCSVGCPLCDTDYRVHRKMCALEILTELAWARQRTYTNWVWITGGEPLDHDLLPLIQALREEGRFNITIATSGHKPVPDAWVYRYGCRLNVSPHDPAKWVQMTGDELNIVPGLNGYRLSAFMDKLNATPHAFRAKRVTPCEGLDSTVDECRAWVMKNRGWTMGSQAHKQWRLA